MSPVHHHDAHSPVSPTHESVEAYAASVREYYAMLKNGVTMDQQTELIQKMHKLRDELLMSVLIDHGQADLIRYVKSARAQLAKQRKNPEE